MRTLKEIFDGLFLPIFQDKKNVSQVARLLYQFRIAFVNRSPDSLEFFGSNLIGNIKITFTTRDKEIVFEDILGVGIETVDYYIKTDALINKDFKISSDVFNLTMVYLAHMFFNCKLLSEEERKLAAKTSILLFLYRCITAILNWYFKYPISRDKAEAIYAELSNRYLIKKLGSWGAVLDYRAEDMLNKSNPNFKAILAFTDDDVVKYINDSQGRIKDTFKNIYTVFDKINKSGEKIATSTSSTQKGLEGEEEMIDLAGGADGYINYLLGVLPDKHSFIKKEVLDIISNVVKTTQRKYIEKTLVYLSEGMSDTKASKIIEEFVRIILTHSYDYLKDNKYLSKNSKNIIAILGKLKGVYMASRNNEDTMLTIRDMGDTLVKDAIGKINSQATAATRSAVVLYICLRTYARHHFTE